MCYYRIESHIGLFDNRHRYRRTRLRKRIQVFPPKLNIYPCEHSIHRILDDIQLSLFNVTGCQKQWYESMAVPEEKSRHSFYTTTPFLAIVEHEQQAIRTVKYNYRKVLFRKDGKRKLNIQTSFTLYVETAIRAPQASQTCTAPSPWSDMLSLRRNFPGQISNMSSRLLYFVSNVLQMALPYASPPLKAPHQKLKDGKLGFESRLSNSTTRKKTTFCGRCRNYLSRKSLEKQSIE